MTAGGRCAWVTGSCVIAVSVMLAMTVVLLSSQMKVVGPNPAAWLPETLVQNYSTNASSEPLLRAPPFYNSTDKILEEVAQNGTGQCYEQHTKSTEVIGLPGNVSEVTLTDLSTSAPPFYNITGKILEEMAWNGTGPCYEQHTTSTRVIGLPGNVSEVLTLSTNVVHKFWLQSYNSSGEPRCAGGDFYELDLSSPLWKSRPLIEDLQNGTYGVQFMVPDVYAGAFDFSASLLFDAYHGLDHIGEDYKIARLFASLRINFVAPANLEANSVIANASTPHSAIANASTTTDGADNQLTRLKRCDPDSDFEGHEWSGRWSRPVDNDTCLPDEKGRYYHCFSDSENIPCLDPSWCSGNVSKLESVGWSYSAHCAFHIFEAQEAWDCLAGRWLFFWGDSNHVDTIRNMLSFILQVPPPPGRDYVQVERSYQNWFNNPENLDQEVRITNHYNGHPVVDWNRLGLDSLDDPLYHNYTSRFFQGKRYPDTMIMNSGLHDGWNSHNVPDFVRSVDKALTFWSDLFGNLTGKPPQLIYRTTIAVAGWSRGIPTNAHKMEVFNRIMTEKVHQRFPWVKFVDEFDMSFPFHYDNSYSDGAHYGRPPDGKHLYFVDVMLGHILLNAICPRGA